LEKEALKEWVAATLDRYEDQDIFLIDVDWNASTKKLVTYVDSESDLSLSRCQAISRFLEHQLDATELIGLKYALEVSSPGLDRPLVLSRQYPKNIGRILRIKLKDGSEIIGKLTKTSSAALTLEIEKKQGKKQKAIYEQEIQVLFEDIEKTFVEIRF